MALTEGNFIIREHASQLVNPFWKYAILCLFILSSLCGVACCVLLFNVNSHFHGNCFLGANIVGFLSDDNSIILTYGEEPTSKWGDRYTCQVAIYSPLSLSIFAMVWLSIFIINGKGGRSPGKYGPPQAWLIVAPACSFSVVPLIFGFYVGSTITSGISTFCTSLLPISKGCGDLDMYKWDNFHSMEKLGTKITAILVTLWIVASSWFLVFTILFLRCILHPDFRILKTSRSGGSQVSVPVLSIDE